MSDFTPSGKFDIVFLGTGVSTAVPNLAHILNAGSKPCAVCSDAMHVSGSRNKRNNVSLAVLFDDNKGKQKCVVVDVGKTMRDACMTQLPKVGVKEVSGIIITHGHADAIFGLDDVRDLQKSVPVKVSSPSGESITGFRIESGAIPIFLNQDTMDTVSKAFGYLTGTPAFLDEANNILERRVAFSFGREGEFVYISDVNLKYLQEIPRIKVFVIDVLNQSGIFSHMGLDEALDVIALLKPEMAYFVGMSCSLGLHEEVEAKLATLAPNTHLAYDGLVLKGFAME
eukprot:CAMPEP_0174960630 /NCGR_PEP_ID=MMETSP0004_2-20121128/3805_1 /TAXON_ID=420556 /ORGANISM="Ochromonas sp., Strain CCMP1393" /LENGTH=283 /DNA_ID=CAMNT_0016209013 /DNA_START=20 /DNA_END=871 /DNA_ORIENTATION=+